MSMVEDEIIVRRKRSGSLKSIVENEGNKPQLQPLDEEKKNDSSSS